MKTRIAVVLPNLEAIGAQIYAVAFAKALSKRGLAPELVLQSGAGCLGHREEAVPTIHLTPKAASQLPGVRVLVALGCLLWRIRGSEYTHILCVTPLLARFVCAVKAVGWTSAKVIVEEHGYPPLYLRREDGMRIWEVWFYRSTFFLYRFADKIRVISEGIRDYYWSRGLKQNVIWFPNLVDIEGIILRAAAKAPTAVASDGRNIAYCGRLTPQKNVAFLLRSFAVLESKVPVTFWIIGDGPDRSALEAAAVALRVNARVRFLGFSGNPFPMLRQMDLLVMASEWEGAPLVLLESLAIGLPVVARDCQTGPSEILGASSERGYLLPHGVTEAEFAASIEHALVDPLREQRVAAGQAYLNERHSLSARAQEQIETFLGVSLDGTYVGR